jgi:glycosyltransferase involved in cell wall biosynthesis
MTIHDLSLLLHPETHEAARVRRARRRLPLMLRAARLVITPTESVRREVCEHLHLRPERVFAVPEAARAVFRPMTPAKTLDARKRLGVEEDFLLFVGTIEPRKNLPILLEAYAELLRSAYTRARLVIAGQRGWLTGELFERLGESGLADRVIFTGYLTDEELCALYSSCSAFVYPSLYEGFGLPPLEAMACGAPVIASRIASLSEVCGEAAIYFEPRDASRLAEQMSKLLFDEKERGRLALEGRKRAAEFSWERAARRTLEVYREAIAGGL